ncbi:hypothetical protein [Parendozoicomonas haliclonae]|uniref:Uncharacterized protein n=1 Tax=Parendozoicomonas haliclonae TaxID=1960125 RepID=A0A1X7AJ57_9GAMM|nr:hypothetical protein [Parendozoicomonas haliclonae]SMA45564.1 hypothetical protein EHSB41UT_01951 [Parendozoicomonas haliclonae]
MLHREFAINPDQIQDISDLRLLEARFGFDKGALISTFPKKWFGEVAERISRQASSNQADYISEDLKILKNNALASFSRNFDDSEWFQSAAHSHEEKPFHRIVDNTQPEPPTVIHSIHNLRETDFSITPQIERTAEALAHAAEALLANAEKVTLFDPYFCITKTGYRKTLLAMMALCRKTRVRFHVYAEEDGKPDWDSVIVPALQTLLENIPDNIELNFYHVSDDGSGYVHARGLFTGKGGIIYDRGFEEPNDHDQRQTPTDVQLMNRSTLEQKARDYNETQLSPRLNLKNRWSGVKCSK